MMVVVEDIKVAGVPSREGQDERLVEDLSALDH